MSRILGSFHHRVTRSFNGMKLRIRTDGVWAYPPLKGALQAKGMDKMETFIFRRQNMVAQYIAMQPILDVCLEAERRPGLQVPMRWYEQAGMDLTGLREAAEDYGDGKMDGEGTGEGRRAWEGGDVGDCGTD